MIVYALIIQIVLYLYYVLIRARQKIYAHTILMFILFVTVIGLFALFMGIGWQFPLVF
jgi:hypothetical protein